MVALPILWVTMTFVLGLVPHTVSWTIHAVEYAGVSVEVVASLLLAAQLSTLLHRFNLPATTQCIDTLGELTSMPSFDT